jgi:hypothetical protein
MTDHRTAPPDLSVAEALALQIERLFRDRPIDQDHGETLSALMLSIGGELVSIECRECRKLAARSVELELPGIITSALVSASERFADEPPTSDHVH